MAGNPVGSQRISQAHACQAEGLGEGAAHDQIVVLFHQMDQASFSKLDIGLVQEDDGIGALQYGPKLLLAHYIAGGIVGGTEKGHLGSGRNGFGQLMLRPAGGEDGPGRGHDGQDLVVAESGRRNESAVTRIQEDARECVHDPVHSRPDEDHILGKAGIGGKPRQQLLRLGVPLHGHGGEGLLRCGAGSVGILVAAQLDYIRWLKAVLAGDLAKALARHIGLEKAEGRAQPGLFPGIRVTAQSHSPLDRSPFYPPPGAV